MGYINVKAMVDEILDDVAEKMKTVEKPKALLILYAGHDPASESYMKGKIRDCERCGIPWMQFRCLTQREMAMRITAANYSDDIGGIIAQLPFPYGWDKNIVNLVSPKKDVDGFVAGSLFKPCTPEGIVHIMHKELGDDLSGKRALIVGRGKLVGRPLYDLLQYGENMSVMQVGSSEKRLDDVLYGFEDNVWDAVITAVGKPGLFSPLAADSSLFIDAGISVGEDGNLHGDCTEISGNENWPRITPVPGGVGPMTRAMLMKHMAEVQE